MSRVFQHKASGPELPPLRPCDERFHARETSLSRAVVRIEGLFMRLGRSAYRRRLDQVVQRAREEEAKVESLDDSELRNQARRAGIEVRRTGWGNAAATARLLGALSEASWRSLGLRPHDVQLVGVKIMLDGKLVEMATGEGKTLVAGLAAAASALGGVPAHVVTVNDYLATRDADFVHSLMDFLGLAVGTVVSGTPRDERAAAYRLPVCYCTNKELSFDYLRDMSSKRSSGSGARFSAGRFETGQDGGTLNGLLFAIIDEADSILVDEARTPLILSEGAEDPIGTEVIERVMDFACSLQEDVDFRILKLNRSLVLRKKGRKKIDMHYEKETSGPLFLDVLRDELVQQALTALHLYERDEHYLVRDGKVEIIDEYTGRVMPDRSWQAGLHQMIEVKESCSQTEARRTIARMTYQRFFRRYRKLAGMTGTATEVNSELWNVYRLDVCPVSTHKPSVRQCLPDRIFTSSEEKWHELVKRVHDLHTNGVPVLVGARSVKGTQEAYHHLRAAGFSLEKLNATDDSREAEIIAVAGHCNQITVATNMAGRGTDIALGKGAATLGGLHVIMTERHDAGRIDRQLMGRCARQGDPGCFQAFLSLEDPLCQLVRPVWLLRLAKIMVARGDGFWARLLIRWSQGRLERTHSKMREQLLKSDQSEMDLLAFSGRSE